MVEALHESAEARCLAEECSGRQRIPDPLKAETGEVRLVARGEFGDAVMAQSQRQPGIKDDAATNAGLRSRAPNFIHESRRITGIVDELPGGVTAEGFDESDGVRRIERVLHDGRVTQENVELDENQFTNGDGARGGRQRGKEGASVAVLRAVAVEGVEQEIGVEGNHRRLLACAFIGVQSPVFHRGAKRAKVSAFREAPVSIAGRVGRGLALDHLLSSAPEEFRHAEVKLSGKTFDLLVKRVGQLDFGLFHEAMIRHGSKRAQGRGIS